MVEGRQPPSEPASPRRNFRQLWDVMSNLEERGSLDEEGKIALQIRESAILAIDAIDFFYRLPDLAMPEGLTKPDGTPVDKGAMRSAWSVIYTDKIGKLKRLTEGRTVPISLGYSEGQLDPETAAPIELAIWAAQRVLAYDDNMSGPDKTGAIHLTAEEEESARGKNYVELTEFPPERVLYTAAIVSDMPTIREILGDPSQ